MSTTFSIEIFKGGEINADQTMGCLVNEYEVEATDITSTLNRLISEVSLNDLVNGLEISIQKEA